MTVSTMRQTRLRVSEHFLRPESLVKADFNFVMSKSLNNSMTSLMEDMKSLDGSFGISEEATLVLEAMALVFKSMAFGLVESSVDCKGAAAGGGGGGGVLFVVV